MRISSVSLKLLVIYFIIWGWKSEFILFSASCLSLSYRITNCEYENLQIFPLKYRPICVFSTRDLYTLCSELGCFSFPTLNFWMSFHKVKLIKLHTCMPLCELCCISFVLSAQLVIPWFALGFYFCIYQLPFCTFILLKTVILM